MDGIMDRMELAIAQSFPDATVSFVESQTPRGSEDEERGGCSSRLDPPSLVYVEYPILSTTEVSHPEVLFCWFDDNQDVKLVSVDDSEDPHFINYFSGYFGKEVIPLTMSYNEVIAGRRDDGQCTIQIRLSWKDWLDSKSNWSNQILSEVNDNYPVSYAPGDDVGILPENTNEMALKVIQKLKTVPDLEKTHCLMIQEEKVNIAGPGKEWSIYKNLPPATVVEWFKKLLDITTPPTQSFLGDLVIYAADSKQKEDLKMLSEDMERYEQWKHSKLPTVLSFLEEFSSLSIPAEVLIHKLPLMKPCFYSVSSTLLISPTSVDLTVEAVKCITEDDSSRRDLCSMYLNQANIGSSVNAFFKSKPRFHLPENQNVPIIMVGLGKDTAPFRSFWMHRAELMKVQNNWEQQFSMEDIGQKKWIFTEEKWNYHNLGVIELAPTAYSREAAVEIESLLHNMMIYANARRIYEILDGHGGHIYVCGDVNMANGVKWAMLQIFEDHVNMNPDEAALVVDNLFDNGRYHEDILGSAVGARKSHLECNREARNEE